MGPVEMVGPVELECVMGPRLNGPVYSRVRVSFGFHVGWGVIKPRGMQFPVFFYYYSIFVFHFSLLYLNEYESVFVVPTVGDHFETYDRIYGYKYSN